MAVTRRQLNFSQVVSLSEIIKARFESSGMQYTEFANSVNSTPFERAKFSFDISAKTVESVATACGMKSPLTRKRESNDNEDCIFLTQRVAKMEDQLNKLAHTVLEQSKLLDKLKPLCS